MCCNVKQKVRRKVREKVHPKMKSQWLFSPTHTDGKQNSVAAFS